MPVKAGIFYDPQNAECDVTNYLKRALIGSAAVLAFSQAHAADVPAPAGCTVMGIISVGGIYDWQNVKFLGQRELSTDQKWRAGFGDGAVGLTCDALNLQVDAAIYGLYGTDNVDFSEVPAIGTRQDVVFKSTNGHIGSAAFIRNDQMSIGVDASVVFQNYNVSDHGNGETSNTERTYRVGAFGQFFAGDNVTFGASAHYFNGTNGANGIPSSGYDKASQHGFEFTGLIKYYPTDNLALTLQGDATTGRVNYGYYEYNNTGYAATVEAEYKFSGTPLSIFAGGLWAKRQDIARTYLAQYNDDDKQIFAGLKLDLGGAKNTSLALRDRTGTYDNTSTLLEKLPTLDLSNFRAFFSPYN